jgi:hypothetical protein
MDVQTDPSLRVSYQSIEEGEVGSNGVVRVKPVHRFCYQLHNGNLPGEVIEKDDEQSGGLHGEEGEQRDLLKEHIAAGREQELTGSERAKVADMLVRDRQICAHEETRYAAAGPYALGKPMYQYEVGPDGKKYVVDGKVRFDITPVPGDPQATISKMKRIRYASLSAAGPSVHDRQVAIKASQYEIQARRQIKAEEPLLPEGDGSSPPRIRKDDPASPAQLPTSLTYGDDQETYAARLYSLAAGPAPTPKIDLLR